MFKRLICRTIPYKTSPIPDCKAVYLCLLAFFRWASQVICIYCSWSYSQLAVMETFALYDGQTDIQTEKGEKEVLKI